MANEAVLKVRTDDPIDFTCADTSGLEKGALLKLVDPRTVSGGNITTADRFGGIVAREKIANDGRTQVACFTRGIFDLTNSTVAVQAGDWVCMSGANTVRTCNEAELASGAAIGRALETASSGEVFEVLAGGY